MELKQIEDLIYERNITLIKDDIPSNKMKGLYFDNTIIYDRSLCTSAEKACVLAEELGHYETSAGDILDYSTVNSKKQERKARLWAADRLISFEDFIEASRQGIRNRYELAEFLNVTEEFLQESIQMWKEKYGNYISFGGYFITLEPLGIWTNERFNRVNKK